MDPPLPELLALYQIEYLYHLTSVSNLPSILTYGLRSNYFVNSHNLIQTDISDPQVQAIRHQKVVRGINLHHYVPLYFCPKNPMLYKRQQLQEEIILLGIDTLILWDVNTVFSDGNAACHNTKFYWQLEQLPLLDWEVINSPNWGELPEGKRIKCAEVLVYPHLPIRWISKIFTNSAEVLYQVESLLGKRSIEAVINPDLYFI